MPVGAGGRRRQAKRVLCELRSCDRCASVRGNDGGFVESTGYLCVGAIRRQSEVPSTVERIRDSKRQRPVRSPSLLG